MIFIYDGNKFKQTKYSSSEELIKVFNLNELIDAKELDKQLLKGNNVYCWVSPFHYEINGTNRMYWGLDPLIEQDNYYDDKDNV
jgi:hypothetical protein